MAQFEMVVRGIKFEGESMAEVQDKVNRAADEFVQQYAPPAPPLDRGDYFATHYSDPAAGHKMLHKQVMGEDPEVTRQKINHADAVAQRIEIQMVNAQVTRDYPWLLNVSPEDDLKNSQAVHKIMG